MGFITDLLNGLKSKSTSKINSITEHIVNVSTDIANSCGTSVKQTQSNIIRNTGWSFFSDTNVEQTTTVNQQCFSNASIENELRTSILNKIDQEMKNDGINLTQIMGRDGNMETTIRNKIEKGVTLKNIQTSYINIEQKQDNEVVNENLLFGSDVNIKQGATVYALAVLQTVSSTGVFDDIKNVIEQKNSAVSNFLAPFWDNLGMIIVVILIIVALVFGLPLALRIIRGSGGGEKSGGAPDLDLSDAYGYDEY